MIANLKLLSAAYLLSVFSSAAYAEGLDTLIEVGRAQAEIQKAYEGETKAYKGVKSAVDKGAIKKGESKDDIKSRYGDPVVSFNDQATKREKWVYRPASSDAFKGERVNIYFDNKGLVDEVQQVSK